MSRSYFRFRIEVRSIGGRTSRQPTPLQDQATATYHEDTYPRFSWYSATFLTNSSRSSVYSIDSPCLGGIVDTLSSPPPLHKPHTRLIGAHVSRRYRRANSGIHRMAEYYSKRQSFAADQHSRIAPFPSQRRARISANLAAGANGPQSLFRSLSWHCRRDPLFNLTSSLLLPLTSRTSRNIVRI